ncbi:MAG: toll/interleukin-1 receptor domain-containing protein, partial [bacterium]|nr:toll/interleukin-1 receptor domain-containing protein [bacterium]
MGSCRCKMCGGHIHYDDNLSVATCEYCGTEQTVFRTDNEKQLMLFNRANILRMQNEFDKAQLTYDNILIDDPKCAEAHWGICLCRYGIEYVDSKATGKKVPTCHRTAYKTIFEDLDYIETIENADVVAKKVYEREAKVIDKLQKDILSISQKEEPYDVFISYKEHDESNNRTEDSIKAESIYSELTKKGYRVFFSKKSLANKDVSEYEPIIFAALMSSKVMLSIGSKKEYFNAIWEKNEWSRFISFIQDKQDKYLIPCYFNMELKDLPIEFLSFEEELLDGDYLNRITRRVEKLLNRSNSGSNNQTNKSLISNLIERAKYCLSNSEFDKVKEIVENILNVDYKCAEAYFYNILAKNNCKNE